MARPRDWQRTGVRGLRRALLAASWVASFWPCGAQAQRGGPFVDQRPSPHTVTSDFPGLFDANLAKPGSFVFEGPSLSIFYGVGEHLTLGSNALYAVPLLSAQPGGLLFSRYLVRSNESLRSTLDVTLGGFSMSTEGETDDADDDSQLNHSLVLVGSNTALLLSEAHTLTLNLLAGHITFSQDDAGSNGYTALSFTGLLTGATYTVTASDWFAASLSVLPVPLLVGSAESDDLLVEVDLSELDALHERTLYRGHASFRAWKRWLFEVGAMGIGTQPPLPWLNVAVHTR